MVTVTYSSNNSGGSWWLTDDDWRNLEAAGWRVEWLANKQPTGVQVIDDFHALMIKDGRFLGALAVKATKEAASIGEAITDWMLTTKQDPYAEGCNCCGRPHNFD